MPTTDDEIQEKYLERAIRELNQLTHRLQECSHCPRGNLMPVLGSGHPQADVMLLKYAPTAAEIEEGVAFYGRAGNALMKSFKRLGIDPLTVYGTLCVKCPVSDPSLAAGECVERVVEEVAIVQPRCIVVMGDRALEALNDLDLPLARRDRAAARRDPVADTDDRRALRARHRRLARLRGVEAGVLDRVPRARRLVRRPAAVLIASSRRRAPGDPDPQASSSGSEVAGSASAAQTVQSTGVVSCSRAILFSASVSVAPQLSQRCGSEAIVRSSRSAMAAI